MSSGGRGIFIVNRQDAAVIKGIFFGSLRVLQKEPEIMSVCGSCCMVWILSPGKEAFFYNAIAFKFSKCRESGRARVSEGVSPGHV